MPDTRPNLILFATDQQRGDHLSIAGHPLVKTPNVDSFVNHGAYLPNAYLCITQIFLEGGGWAVRRKKYSCLR